MRFEGPVLSACMPYHDFRLSMSGWGDWAICRLSGRIYQAPTVGDVDGDGVLDVVVAVAALEGYTSTPCEETPVSPSLR